MTRLVPAGLRAWRCHCGNRHDHVLALCPWTGLPRDLKPGGHR